MFANHVTEELKLPVPWTLAEHLLAWLTNITFGAHETSTEVIVEADEFTATVAVPDFAGSCVDVAVMTALPATAGAVNDPDALIVPLVADQVTAELKLPVPWTVAEYWLVWPVSMAVGVQDTPTEVIVEVELLTVSVAELLVAEPAAFVTVTTKCEPLSAIVVAGVV